MLREKQLISSVMTVARKDWGLISHNPVSEVRWPSKPRPRDLRPSPAEIEAVRAVAGPLSSATGRTFHAFLFSCETAMRLGEVCRIVAGDVTGRVVHVPITKNGDPRDVPLSTEALRLLAEMPAVPHGEPLFDVSADVDSTLWRRLCGKAEVVNLRYHDSRREAASRLARVLSPMQLAKVTGHKDLSIPLNTYYKESAADIADLLD